MTVPPPPLRACFLLAILCAVSVGCHPRSRPERRVNTPTTSVGTSAELEKPTASGTALAEEHRLGPESPVPRNTERDRLAAGQRPGPAVAGSGGSDDWPLPVVGYGEEYESPAGFVFQPPSEWAGRYLLEETPADVAASLGALSVVRFLYLPTDAAKTPLPLLSLIAVRRSEGTAPSDQDQALTGIEVQKCGEVVVIATTPAGNPYGDGVDAAGFEALYLALDLRAAVRCRGKS